VFWSDRLDSNQPSPVPQTLRHGPMDLYAQFRMSSREQKWLRSARLLAMPYEATARQRYRQRHKARARPLTGSLRRRAPRPVVHFVPVRPLIQHALTTIMPLFLNSLWLRRSPDMRRRPAPNATDAIGPYATFASYTRRGRIIPSVGIFEHSTVISRVRERTSLELHILEMQKHAFLVRLFPAEETKCFCGLEHGHAGA
jgi:hypothetical protein